MGRILLPFSGGIDSPAINHALTIAQRTQHTLVVVSLLDVGSDGSQMPLAGFIEQSVDFLELIQNRARRRHVPLDVIELYSHDIPSSIQYIASEMECAAVLLFTRDDRAVLLSNGEAQQLLYNEYLPVFTVRLMVRKTITATVKGWLERIVSPEVAQQATSLADIYRIQESDILAGETVSIDFFSQYARPSQCQE